MDIAITQKKSSRLKHYFIWPLLTVILSFAGRQLWLVGQSDFSVNESSIVISQVSQGNFTVSVRGTGTLVPDHIQWLSANIDASVERIAVKAGKFVHAGELIAVLSNPQLVHQLEERQWELEAQEAETIAARISQESELLSQKSNMLNAKLNYESSKLKSLAHDQLFKQASGAVSKLDYEKTLLETNQFRLRWAISNERFIKMQENLTAKNNARKARLNITKKSVARVQQQVDSLFVKASMDSIVQEIPLEIGQRITMGSKIAKLAKQHSLIAELQIPEIQIREVRIGQRVVIDTRNSKIDGVVSRINPVVINGNVQVDVAFSTALPKEARSDLSVDGEIKITEIVNTLYVVRPLFSQSQSRTGIYKISEDGLFAERVMVSTGHGSVNEIQISEGLNAGDRIIVSDSTGWDAYRKIRIK